MTLVSSGNSYAFYSGDGSTTTYSLGFQFIAESHLVVTVDGSIVSTDDYTVNAGSVIFDTAPNAGTDIRLSRATPRTALVDFQSFGSITEEELDLDQTQLIYLIQEAFETDDNGAVTSGAENIVWNPTASHWEAARSGTNQHIGNVADPGDSQDAATKSYVDNAVQFGVVGMPQAWYFDGSTTGNSFVLTGGDGMDARYLVVSIDGVLQIPFQDYVLSSSGADPTLDLVGTGLQASQELSVQNFGVMRSLPNYQLAPGSVGTDELASSAVTSNKLAANAVTTLRIEDGAVTEPKLAADAVTSAKIAAESITWDHIKEADFAPDQVGPPYPVLKLNTGGDLTIDTVDAADVNGLSAFVSATPVSSLSAATGPVSMGGNDLTNLPNSPPTNNSAASKLYVDNQVGAATESGVVLIARTLVTPSPSSTILLANSGTHPEFYDTTTYSHFTAHVTGLEANGCNAIQVQVSQGGGWVNESGWFGSMKDYLDFMGYAATVAPGSSYTARDTAFDPQYSGQRRSLTITLNQAQAANHRFTSSMAEGWRLESRDWTAPADKVTMVQLRLFTGFDQSGLGNPASAVNASTGCYVTLYGHKKSV